MCVVHCVFLSRVNKQQCKRAIKISGLPLTDLDNCPIVFWGCLENGCLQRGIRLNLEGAGLFDEWRRLCRPSTESLIAAHHVPASGLVELRLVCSLEREPDLYAVDSVLANVVFVTSVIPQPTGFHLTIVLSRRLILWSKIKRSFRSCFSLKLVKRNFRADLPERPDRKPDRNDQDYWPYQHQIDPNIRFRGLDLNQPLPCCIKSPSGGSDEQRSGMAGYPERRES